MRKNFRLVFTGGGTGGHVYPNIAVFEALKEQYPDGEFLYIGTRRGSEGKILRSLAKPMDFVAINSRGLPQNLKSPKSLLALFAMLLGTIKSYWILKRFKPDIVIGSGGYVAAPVLLAAALLKIKIFIHEQNLVPGRLNRFVTRFASRIGISFPATADFFPANKTVHTGYPLRRAILAMPSENSREKYRIPEKNKVLFICSGSTGARTINRAAAEIIPRLLTHPDWTIILSTGKSYSKEYKAYDDTVNILQTIGLPPEIEGRLIVREYFDRIDEIYAITDLVVSRAGAGAIKEITSLGVPAIFIPKIDLPADHQILNAQEVEKTGGARMLDEEIAYQKRKRSITLSETRLYQTIVELLDDADQLARMRRNLLRIERLDSTAIIVREIDALIRNRERTEEHPIKIYYLQSPNEEKNYEMLFHSTTFGGSFPVDVCLDNVPANVRFEIRFVSPGDDLKKIIIRRIKGEIHVNGEPMSRWKELSEGDEIGVDGNRFIFKSYQEKLKEYPYEKAARRHTIGSALGILVSRLGGFIRVMVGAAVFGAGLAIDIFAVGLTVANFMRRIVAENAMGSTFLPIFLRLFQRQPRKKTWEASASIITFTLLLALILTMAGMVFAPVIIKILFPGLVIKGLLPEASLMIRLLFPNLLLASLAAVMTIPLKAFNRSGLADVSPVFFSLGAVLGIVLLLPVVGIYSLAYGVLLGGLLQIAFLAPFLIRTLASQPLEFTFRPALKFRTPANRKFRSLLTPVAVDTCLTQLANVADKFFASFLRVGSISFLYFATEIFRLPVAFISRAIGSVALKEHASGVAEFDHEQTRKFFIAGITINLFVLAPVSILMIALAHPLVSVLLERFHFTAPAVTKTALALQFYSIGMIGWGIHDLTTRMFAARVDVRASLFLNFFMLLTHIGLCAILVKTPLRFAGIALATSVSILLFAAIRTAVLKKKLHREHIDIRYREILGSLSKTLTAAMIMVFGIIEAKYIFNRLHFNSVFIENVVLIISLSFIGVSLYFLSSLILKNAAILIFRKKGPAIKNSIPTALLSPNRFFELAARNPIDYAEDYRYKINLFLSSSDWEIKNIGIKLIGLFKDKSKAEQLIELLKSGRGNGFIRRNALNSLRELGVWSQETKETARRLLRDSYYEVRIAALHYLTRNLSANDYLVLRPFIVARLRRSPIEEKLACLKLIAKRGTVEDLSLLNRFYLNNNTLLREELIDVLNSFYRRNLLTAAELRRHLGRILITSNNLAAEFKIKSTLNRIHREIEGQ